MGPRRSGSSPSSQARGSRTSSSPPMGATLVVSAETPARKYRKELELPYAVELGGSKSTFNNGILEVTLPKRKGRSSGVRIKVD